MFNQVLILAAHFSSAPVAHQIHAAQMHPGTHLHPHGSENMIAVAIVAGLIALGILSLTVMRRPGRND